MLEASTITQQNVCSSNPCLHNTTCLNGYTEKGYLCLCQFGYTDTEKYETDNVNQEAPAGA